MARSQDKVYRILNRELGEFGFARTRGGWARIRGLILQHIHLHKFTFTTAFRIHTAVHLASVDYEWTALNGICSYDGWWVRTLFGLPTLQIRRYSFEYRENDESIRRCAMEIKDCVREVVLPWFDEWEDPRKLLRSAKSPLSDDEKAILERLLRETNQAEPSGQESRGE